MEENKKDWVLLGIAILMLVLNLIGLVLSARANNIYIKVTEENKLIKQEYQQYSSPLGIYNDELDDKLQNLMEALVAGINKIKRALWIFVFRFFCGFILALVLILVGVFYNYKKENFLSNLQPDNLVNVACEVLIGILCVYDIISPFLDIGDYIDLLNDMRNVIFDINPKMLSLIP